MARGPEAEIGKIGDDIRKLRASRCPTRFLIVFSEDPVRDAEANTAFLCEKLKCGHPRVFCFRTGIKNSKEAIEYGELSVLGFVIGDEAIAPRAHIRMRTDRTSAFPR